MSIGESFVLFSIQKDKFQLGNRLAGALALRLHFFHHHFFIKIMSYKLFLCIVHKLPRFSHFLPRKGSKNEFCVELHPRPFHSISFNSTPFELSATDWLFILLTHTQHITTKQIASIDLFGKRMYGIPMISNPHFGLLCKWRVRSPQLFYQICKYTCICASLRLYTQHT